MSQNLVTKGTVFAGDVLLGGRKLDKWFIFRLGTGGNVIAGSSYSPITLGPLAQLPSQVLVFDAFLNVLVASTGTTKTLLVGTSGTPGGFLNGISVGTTGIVRPFITTATSGGNTGGFMLVSSVYGTLLMSFSSGSTAAGDAGFCLPKTYPSDSNASRGLGFVPGSTDWTLFQADLYLSLVDITQ